VIEFLIEVRGMPSPSFAATKACHFKKKFSIPQPKKKRKEKKRKTLPADSQSP